MDALEKPSWVLKIFRLGFLHLVLVIAVRRNTHFVRFLLEGGGGAATPPLTPEQFSILGEEVWTFPSCCLSEAVLGLTAKQGAPPCFQSMIALGWQSLACYLAGLDWVTERDGSIYPVQRLRASKNFPGNIHSCDRHTLTAPNDITLLLSASATLSRTTSSFFFFCHIEVFDYLACLSYKFIVSTRLRIPLCSLSNPSWGADSLSATAWIFSSLFHSVITQLRNMR